MQGFVFAPQYDKKPGDATGAFRPGADIFSLLHDISNKYIFDNNLPETNIQTGILNKIKTASGSLLDVVAYFGHGDRNEIGSACFYNYAAPRNNIDDLVQAISSKASSGVKIPLYACMTGDLPQGFAATLASKFSAKDAIVYGHSKNYGHSFTWPYLKKFPGGEFLVDPDDNPLFQRWSATLEDARQNAWDNSTLWARFPWMSDEKLKTAIQVERDLLGRWEVVLSTGGNWHYVFFNNSKVVAVDPKQRNRPLFYGWFEYGANSLMVCWLDQGSFESWNLPLQTNQQTGREASGDYTFTAKKLEPAGSNKKGSFSVEW